MHVRRSAGRPRRDDELLVEVSRASEWVEMDYYARIDDFLHNKIKSLMTEMMIEIAILLARCNSLDCSGIMFCRRVGFWVHGAARRGFTRCRGSFGLPSPGPTLFVR